MSEVQSFLGFASYYRRFVANFSSIATPLHNLSQKNAQFNWSTECDEAFQELKLRLMSSPFLAYPDSQKQFLLDTDASNVGMRAVLSQVLEDGNEVVIAYGSKTLSKSQRNQGTTKKELLAVVTFMTHFKHYLCGAQFVLRTDHKALIWLQSFKDTDGILARWIERLAMFDYVVQHRPGKQHINADALSRLTDGSLQAVLPGEIPNDVTCSACIVNEPNDTPKCVVSEANWSPSFSVDELHTAQLEDPDITVIMGWQEALLDRPLRSDVAMQGVSVCTIRLWSQWKRLKLIEGILYREYYPENADKPVLQLVVPQSSQPIVLKSVHSDVSGGHLGIERTLHKLRQRYYWPFMTTTATEFCQACEVCHSRKSPTPRSKASLIQDHPSFPLEKVAIDIMGPLPVTSRGNRYMIVICDYFTKWTEAFPAPNMRAETVATILVDGFFCRYGIPYQLHSDRGAQFESQLFQHICELLDIRKSRTTPYRPQSDDLVERMNRTLEAMLSAHVNDHHDNWDLYLQRCLLAYRTSVHSSTRQSPAMLMFGREVRLPVDIMFHNPGDQPTTTPDYVTKLRHTLQQAYRHARSAGAIALKRQKTWYDKRSSSQHLQVGDMVRLHCPAVKPGTTPKFHRPWRGPFSILEKIDDVVFRIADQSGKTQTVHTDRLKKFNGPGVVLPPVNDGINGNDDDDDDEDDNDDDDHPQQQYPGYQVRILYDVPIRLHQPIAGPYGLQNRGNIQPPVRYR